MTSDGTELHMGDERDLWGGGGSALWWGQCSILNMPRKLASKRHVNVMSLSSKPTRGLGLWSVKVMI